MAQLRSYTCSKCGGALIVDKDQEVFDCPFCGSKYEKDDFHAEDLLLEAGNSLHQMEFHAAKEKYEMILEKDPHNFIALRGLVFCAGHINAPQYIQRIEKLKKCNIPKMREVLPYAEANALEQDKPYFSYLASMLDIYEEFSVLDKENDELSTQHKEEMGKITKLMDMQDITGNHFSEVAESPQEIIRDAQNADSVSAKSVLLVFLIILFLAGVCASVYFFGPYGILVTVGVFLLFVLIRGLIAHGFEKAKTPHREALKGIHSEMSENTKKTQDLSKQYDAAYLELKKLDPTAKKPSSEALGKTK